MYFTTKSFIVIIFMKSVGNFQSEYKIKKTMRYCQKRQKIIYCFIIYVLRS